MINAYDEYIWFVRWYDEDRGIIRGKIIIGNITTVNTFLDNRREPELTRLT